MKAIVETMQQEWQARLVCVNLVDSNYCYDPSKFVAVLLTCLSTMIQLELPHVNVLSKIDLLDEDALPQRLEFFTDVMDLSELTRDMDKHPLFAKYAKLSAALAGVVNDFGKDTANWQRPFIPPVVLLPTHLPAPHDDYCCSGDFGRQFLQYLGSFKLRLANPTLYARVLTAFSSCWPAPAQRLFDFCVGS